MSAKERYETGQDARRDQAARPARTGPHEDALLRYLGGVAYAEAHHRPEEPDTDDTADREGVDPDVVVGRPAAGDHPARPGG